MAYLGEIMMFSGPYEIEGWLRCDGRLLSLQQNQALYSIIGHRFGGDGIKTFALPNLTNRLPIQTTQMNKPGETWGSASVLITEANLPQHSHAFSDPGGVLSGGVAPHTHAFTVPSHEHSFSIPIVTNSDPLTQGGGSSSGGLLEATLVSFSTVPLPPGATTSYTAPSNTSGLAGTTLSQTEPSKAIPAVGGQSTPTVTIGQAGGVVEPKALVTMPPVLTINFLICTENGDYPPQMRD